MRYMDRVLIGLILIILGFGVLWLSSPDRSGDYAPGGAGPWLFVGLFAVGFVIGSMGLLGSGDDYPALLSGLVLYLIVGALVAVFIYASGNNIGAWTLEDARFGGFWSYWIRVAATWPLELVQRAGILGYTIRS